MRLERIGWIKIKSDQPILLGHYKKDNIKVTNPRIGYDNKAWHLTFGLEEATEALVGPDENTIIGIDVGIKTLATLSTSVKYKNINKSAKVKLLKKRHRRLSKSISRKYESNKAGNKYVKTKNILTAYP